MNFWRIVAYKIANSKVFLIIGSIYLAAYLYAFLQYICTAKSYQLGMIYFSLLFISIIFKFLQKNIKGEMFKHILQYNDDIEFQNQIIIFKKRCKLDFYILINGLVLLLFSIFMSVTSSFLYNLLFIENF